MDLVWVRLSQSGFRQGFSWLHVLFKHNQAISWVWCICFTVKNEQNWEGDSNKYILLSLCLDETSLRRNWVWWLKEKDGEKEREGERALRHKAPVSRDSRQAFMCVFPTVCVCVRACLQHTDVPSGAQDEGGGEKEKMCCPGQCLSVYSSALVKRGHSMLFFKFFIKLWARLTSSCKPSGGAEFPVCMCVYNMWACVPALTGCEIICWKDIYKHISVLQEIVFCHRLAEGVVV